MSRLIDADKLKEHYAWWGTSSNPDWVYIKKVVDQIVDLQPSVNDRGTYQCFHCLSYDVIWDSDFDFQDFGYEGEGIVHICHCANCGAEIEYCIPLGEEDDE